jgi:hypothetical protein
MERPLRRSIGTATAFLVLIWVSTFLVAPAARGQNGGGFDAEFTISGDEGAVVLSYQRDIAALAEANPTPLLRIYGDGRYVVHYPPYMTMAGSYQGGITVDRLEALIRTAIDGGLLELDVEAVERERRLREAERHAMRRAANEPELFEVSDKESTRIRLRLEMYKPEGVIGPGLPRETEVLWWGLREDAVMYPEIEALRRLASFESELLALVEAQDLERLPKEVE